MKALFSCGTINERKQKTLTQEYSCIIIVFANGGVALAEKKLIIHSQRYTGESKVISMRLPMDMLTEIDRVARETGRTRNEIMQTSLEFALENMTIEP